MITSDSDTSVTIELDTYESAFHEQVDYAPVLYEKLRDKRRKIAEVEQIKASKVVPLDSLKEMATNLPQTVGAFRQIRGIGEVRMKYTDDFLPIIRNYCEKHEIDSTENVTKGLNTNVTEGLNTYESPFDKQNDYDPVLFKKLRDKRRMIANTEQIKASTVLSINSLKEMATNLPQTKKAFRQIHGIGNVRMKYADDILLIIRDYCKEHEIDKVEIEIETTETSGGSNDYSLKLFNELCIKRKSLAEEEGKPLYLIFYNKSLQEMATYFPQTKEAFLQIHGVGPVKVERYADDFLSIIRDYCKKHGIDSTAEGTETLNTSEATSERQSGYSQELFEQLQDKCKILEKTEQEGIFTDGTLKEMATSFPRTGEAFVQIRGVSPRKMEKYADDFLPIIRDYCKEHGID